MKNYDDDEDSDWLHRDTSPMHIDKDNTCIDLGFSNLY